MFYIPESRLDRIIFGCNSRISLSELYTSGSWYFCPVLFENLFMLCQNTLKTWLRSNVQGFSQILNWMQVWALTRPLSDIHVLEPLQCHSGNMFVIIIVDWNFFFLKECPLFCFHQSCQVLSPCWWTYPHNMMQPPPCITVGMVFWRVVSSVGFQPNVDLSAKAMKLKVLPFSTWLLLRLIPSFLNRWLLLNSLF